MSIASSIAVSGLSAAALRLQVSASNVANVYSAGPLPGGGASFPGVYVPQSIDQVAMSDGSVGASVTAVSPASVPTFAPSAPFADSSGMVAMPNVDLTNEAVQQLTARISYAANLAVLKTDMQMTSALLDITA